MRQDSDRANAALASMCSISIVEEGPIRSPLVATGEAAIREESAGGAEPPPVIQLPPFNQVEQEAGGPRGPRRGLLPGLPRTMSGLIAGGFLVATLPLLAALYLAGSAVDDLSRQTEITIREGLAVIRSTGELRDDVADLDRNLRQYAVLRDPAMLSVMNGRVDVLEGVLARLQQHTIHAPVDDHLRNVHDSVDAVKELLRGGLTNDELRLAVGHMRSTGEDADAIFAAGRSSLDTQVSQLQQATDQARHTEAMCALALVPLAVLLALTLSWAITRPLQELSRHIESLGDGRYSRPVVIGFPREMWRLAAQLDWLRRRLSQLEAEKDRFLRHVSHELKTPLATLREGAQLFREGVLGSMTGPQTEVAGIMSESAEELNQLIGNLLDFAEWRAGRLHSEEAFFDSRALIDEVLAGHRLSMARRGVIAEVKLRADRLWGRRMQLRVALDNLVSNATKYAPSRSTITIETAVEDKNYLLSVRDRGHGVPEEQKKAIFEPFVRGSGAHEHAVRGTGIGLSIVREVVLAHGGYVEVEDAHPGARFRMAWPLRAEAGGGRPASAGGL